MDEKKYVNQLELIVFIVRSFGLPLMVGGIIMKKLT